MNNAASYQDLMFDPLSLSMGLALGLAAGCAFHFWKRAGIERANAREISILETQIAALDARLESERAGLGDHFQRLAMEALQSNTQSFLTLAQEKLKAAQADGAHAMDRKSLEIEKMVKPVQEQLLRMNAVVEQLQGTDKALRDDLFALHRETSKLSGALRNPSAQGKWGEFILETILEKANLIKGVHYDTQNQIEGGRRPDVIINMHDGFRIAIDSKAPINEYVVRLEEDLSSDDLKNIQSNMARAVRAHVKALGAKAYQDNVGGSDFVILFLPSEMVFSGTLRADPEIVDFAAENHVVIASPTLIMSLLRVVGLSWRQVEMAKNAQEISALGAELHKRLCKFFDHFTKVGKSMHTALNSYNDAVGSMDRSVMPAVRKFKKLHAVNQSTVMPEITQFENSPRPLLSVSDMGDEYEDDLPEETIHA